LFDADKLVWAGLPQGREITAGEPFQHRLQMILSQGVQDDKALSFFLEIGRASCRERV